MLEIMTVTVPFWLIREKSDMERGAQSEEGEVEEESLGKYSSVISVDSTTRDILNA